MRDSTSIVIMARPMGLQVAFETQVAEKTTVQNRNGKAANLADAVNISEGKK